MLVGVQVRRRKREVDAHYEEQKVDSPPHTGCAWELSRGLTVSRGGMVLLVLPLLSWPARRYARLRSVIKGPRQSLEALGARGDGGQRECSRGLKGKKKARERGCLLHAAEV